MIKQREGRSIVWTTSSLIKKAINMDMLMAFRLSQTRTLRRHYEKAKLSHTVNYASTLSFSHSVALSLFVKLEDSLTTKGCTAQICLNLTNKDVASQ